MKVNITVKELQALANAAYLISGSSVTLHIDTTSGIGNTFGISKDWDDTPIDATDYESW